MVMSGIAGKDFNDLVGLGLTPAMMTALFHKPHDRQFVIELENSITSFINSNAESYELRPMNSYYRLLSHQVAEYHNLKHTLARARDNCVIIFKGDGFENMQGKPFLQNLHPMGLVSYGRTDATATNTNSNKRYRILKRRDDQNNLDKNGGNSNDNNDIIKFQEEQKKDTRGNNDDTRVSLERQRMEKEIQYEQRKQEIFSAPKFGDDDHDNDSDNEETGTLDNSSPQPHKFETSRYKFNNRMAMQEPNEPFSQSNSYRQPDYVNNYTNGYTNGYVNGNTNVNGRRNKKFHPFDNHPRRHPSNATPRFHMPHFMYPTPPMTTAKVGQSPPQFPVMYPAPFPVDGSNGYLAPFMYPPMPGFSPVGPKSGILPASTTTPGPYMTYPFAYPYGQPPAPSPVSSMMYGQFSTPHRLHGSRYPKYGRNSSRSSASKRSTEMQNLNDDALEGNSSTSTMASAATEVDELSEDMQKLI